MRGAILITAVPFVLGLLSTSVVAVFQAQLRMERSVIAGVVGRRGAARGGHVILADWGFYAVVASAAVGARSCSCSR